MQGTPGGCGDFTGNAHAGARVGMVLDSVVRTELALPPDIALKRVP